MSYHHVFYLYFLEIVTQTLEFWQYYSLHADVRDKHATIFKSDIMFFSQRFINILKHRTIVSQ